MPAFLGMFSTRTSQHVASSRENRTLRPPARKARPDRPTGHDSPSAASKGETRPDHETEKNALERAPDLQRQDEQARRFARGCVSVVDLISPGAVEVTRSALHLDDRYVRTLALTGYPRYVYVNWLEGLIDFEEPLELSMHLAPLESGPMIGALSQKLVQLESSRLREARSGKIADAERSIACEDVTRLRDQLQRGDEKIFSASLYLTLRAATLAELDELTRRVEGTLAGLMALSRRTTLEMEAGFRSCLPEGIDHLLIARNLDTSSVATTFPFTSSTLSQEQGILYGVSLHNNSLVVFHPFSRTLENANKVVFAKSGSGKSYAVKVEALRSLLLGIDFYVIDPEDEYRRLCEAVGGQYISLSATSPYRLNPFDVPHITPETPGEDRGEAEDEQAPEDPADPLREKILALHVLLGLLLAEGKGHTLTQREKSILDRALYETYRRHGITADRRTHTQAPPILQHLAEALRELGNEEGLADRLERYVSGSLSRLFAGRSNVDLERRFIVFNIRDLEPELRPVAMLLITDFLWTRVRRTLRPRMLIIDEAWSLIEHEESGRFLAHLARRVRKYGMGLTTITQDVEDFLGSVHGHTILANSSLKVLMKQDSSTIEAIGRTFRLSAGERDFLLSCQKGEGLLFALGSHIAFKVEASPLEHELATTDPTELAALAAQARRSVALSHSAGKPERSGAPVVAPGREEAAS